MIVDFPMNTEFFTLDALFAWLDRDERIESCRVVASKRGDDTVTDIQMRMRDGGHGTTGLGLTIFEGGGGDECVVRFLTDGDDGMNGGAASLSP